MKFENTEIIYSIYCAFSETEYGQRLAKRIRYEKYNLAELSNKEWVSLLGVDVNNLWHMLLTYSLAEEFINYSEKEQTGYFSKLEQTLLLVAAIVHDQGESIVDDISFGDKNESHEAKEKQAFEAYTEAFTPGISSKIKQLIVQARDEIVFNTDNKLGKAFNSIERVGYIRTALRASEQVRNNKAGHAEPGLRWLFADVMINQMSHIIGYANEYSAVSSYLLSEREAINTSFEIITPEDFDKYGNSASDKLTQFQNAQTLWQSWLTTYEKT